MSGRETNVDGLSAWARQAYSHYAFNGAALESHPVQFVFNHAWRGYLLRSQALDPLPSPEALAGAARELAADIERLHLLGEGAGKRLDYGALIQALKEADVFSLPRLTEAGLPQTVVIAAVGTLGLSQVEVALLEGAFSTPNDAEAGILAVEVAVSTASPASREVAWVMENAPTGLLTHLRRHLGEDWPADVVVPPLTPARQDNQKNTPRLVIEKIFVTIKNYFNKLI